jgi:hypothetical protein
MQCLPIKRRESRPETELEPFSTPKLLCTPGASPPACSAKIICRPALQLPVSRKVPG